MTRAPPRRLRIALMREDDRGDCIEKLSFLFLSHECSLGLPKGERVIRLPCFSSGESIAANHQKCRCHESHFLGRDHTRKARSSPEQGKTTRGKSRLVKTNTT